MNTDNRLKWTKVLVEVKPGFVISDRTLQSRKWFEEFCNDHGYKILKWEQGTDPMCGREE